MKTKNSLPVPTKRKVLNLQIIDDVVVSMRSLSSVEVKRNSKGQIEFTVKVYDEDPFNAQALSKKIVSSLKKEYSFNA